MLFLTVSDAWLSPLHYMAVEILPWFVCLCWGLTTRQPLSSPRERKKRDRRDSRGDEREGQGRKERYTIHDTFASPNHPLFCHGAFRQTTSIFFQLHFCHKKMSLYVRKHIFGHMRSSKIQISLHIRAV